MDTVVGFTFVPPLSIIATVTPMTSLIDATVRTQVAVVPAILPLEQVLLTVGLAPWTLGKVRPRSMKEMASRLRTAILDSLPFWRWNFNPLQSLPDILG